MFTYLLRDENSAVTAGHGRSTLFALLCLFVLGHPMLVLHYWSRMHVREIQMFHKAAANATIITIKFSDA